MGTFLKNAWKIVEIEKIQKYLKSIAEIGHSDPLYIWIIVQHPNWSVEGEKKVSKHPVHQTKRQFVENIIGLSIDRCIPE